MCVRVGGWVGVGDVCGGLCGWGGGVWVGVGDVCGGWGGWVGICVMCVYASKHTTLWHYTLKLAVTLLCHLLQEPGP